MSLKKQLTTVTTFSKYLALALFILLPFGGFWLGVEYAKEGNTSSYTKKTQVISNVLPSCEELNIPQEQIDATVAEAIINIDNPWGNEKDFLLLIDRVQRKLRCNIQMSNDGVHL